MEKYLKLRSEINKWRLGKAYKNEKIPEPLRSEIRRVAKKKGSFRAAQFLNLQHSLVRQILKQSSKSRVRIRNPHGEVLEIEATGSLASDIVERFFRGEPR